jgi:CBS domain-containing protein
MTVSHILKAKGHAVQTAKPHDAVRHVVGKLAEHKIGAIVVTDKDKTILGIVSERDVVRHLAQSGHDILDARVDRIMTRAVRTCTMHDTEDHLMTLMTDHRIRHLPVVTEGKLVGMISIGDVVKQRIDAIERESENMRAYIAGAA